MKALPFKKKGLISGFRAKMPKALQNSEDDSRDFLVKNDPNC